MTGSMLKIAAVFAVLAIGPAQAQLNRQTPLISEVAAVIERLFERAPFRTWDDLRMATPRSVNWHLIPPDTVGPEVFRRSGWLEADGRQAGIAACGPRSGPELVVLRVNTATWRATERDAVIATLERTIEVSLEDHQPTMVGEIERFELRGPGGQYGTLRRTENCSREGGAARRRCDTTYTLNVRPNYASAPRVHECRAP